MSTKSLMADRRVKEVTLNHMGKASTLELADGWTYNGESGPFHLTSVNHGHEIVKGAVNPDDKGAKRRHPSAKAPSSSPGVAAPANVPPSTTGEPPERIAGFKGHSIYRTLLFSPELNREWAGWIRSTYAYTPTRMEEATRHQLEGLARIAGADPETLEVRTVKWTKAMEKEARENETAGAPWPLDG